MKVELTKDLQDALWDIVQKLEREDIGIRDQQIRRWRLHEMFWHGYQHVFWSEVNRDWVTPEGGLDLSYLGEEGKDLENFYDFVINIFRAHGEGIIAAMSAQLPAVRFLPDDADKEEDILAARAYSKLAELIARHNDGRLILFGILFRLYIQGMACVYNKAKSSEKYGTADLPVYSTQEIQNPSTFMCPQCGVVEESATTCPDCGMQMEEQPGEKESVPIQTGTQRTPKSRECIEVYGPLYVRIPPRIRNQSAATYLILAEEFHYSYLKDQYPQISERISPSSGGEDAKERAYRAPLVSPTYGPGEDQNYLTMRRCWLRTWAFNILGEDVTTTDDEGKIIKVSDLLKQKFPNGCFVTFVEKEFAEAEDEDMDDHWTLIKAGLSEKLHADALGTPLVPLQEIRNTLANMAIETVEHGIPDVFVDPDVMDFNVYGRRRAAPGYKYPARPKAGKALQDSFYETGRATLSREVGELKEAVDEDSQFVTGSFPSIYGGAGQGSKTFSEYAASRQQALQRLSIAWTYTTIGYGKLMLKACNDYVQSMLEDEKFVKSDNGTFINVWIRRTELKDGKVSDIEPESLEGLPISSLEIRQMFMDLLQLNSPDINEIIGHPENLRIIKRALSIPDFVVPDDDQRMKQVAELQELAVSAPGPDGQSSIMPEEIDNHQVHAETVKSWLVSLAGMDLKRTNPPGYQNCVLHYEAHNAKMQEMTQQQQPQQEQPQ